MSVLNMSQPDFTEQELKQLLSYVIEFGNFRALPEYAPVQKGDILKTTALVDGIRPGDTRFSGVEILVLGYDGIDTILGTSFQRGHPAYLVKVS